MALDELAEAASIPFPQPLEADAFSDLISYLAEEPGADISYWVTVRKSYVRGWLEDAPYRRESESIERLEGTMHYAREPSGFLNFRASPSPGAATPDEVAFRNAVSGLSLLMPGNREPDESARETIEHLRTRIAGYFSEKDARR